MRWGMVAIGVLAFPAQAAEPVTYKGRIIVLGDSPAAAQCLDLAKKGIDMVEGLPAKLRILGNAVKEMKCDPPRGSGEVRDNVVGIYTMTSKTEAKGYIDFRRNPAFLSAAQYAVSTVTNGIYAGWHRTYVQAAKDPAQRDKAQRLEAILTKRDLAGAVKAECEILATTHDTMTALDLDPRHISGLSRVMRDRNC